MESKKYNALQRLKAIGEGKALIGRELYEAINWGMNARGLWVALQSTTNPEHRYRFAKSEVAKVLGSDEASKLFNDSKQISNL